MNQDTFSNKVIVVTGSSMGIGKEIAVQLASRGASVVLNGRNESRLERAFLSMTGDGRKVSYFAGDVSENSDCQQLIQHAIKKFGRLDVLINNAGISMEGKLEDLNPNVFRKLIDVNVIGAAQVTKAAIPHLKMSRGSLVFVSSVAGLYGLPEFSPYSCSKMAVNALAQSLRMELRESNVHVGVAFPGFTENDPEKMIYDSTGKLIPQPKRAFANPKPVSDVAREIVQMIEFRREKCFTSKMGWLVDFTSRHCPWLLQFVLRQKYRKYKESTLPGKFDDQLNAA